MNDYINGMCFIVPLKLLRKTPNVEFHIVPHVIEGLDAIDRVKHQPGAVSPTISGQEENKYWYMHPNQEDNLLVYGGKRLIGLYTVEHGKVENFEVTADYIKHGDKVILDEPGILSWHTNVFHRIVSPEGSMSSNFAKHFDGFDIKTNFSIYELDTETGKFEIVRLGSEDQP